ncbi:MAG: ComEC/Rec2 family competence protein [Victivallaceae bacterium]|nr:ComEC/Rec2 family competence protein [Victivallaceae bacterium]
MNNFWCALKNIAKVWRSKILPANTHPGIIVLCGVICGNTADWRVITGTLLLALWLLKRRHKLIFITALTLSLIGVFLQWQLPHDQYLKLLNNRDAAATIKVRISDPSCVGENSPWLPPPRMIKAEIAAVKLSGENDFKPSTGSIIIRAKELNPFYGDTLELKGFFQDSRRDSIYQKIIFQRNHIIKTDKTYGVIGFDYADFLKNRGIQRVFYASEYTPIEYHTSLYSHFYRKILQLRGSVLNGVTQHLKSIENKQMIATLLFGCPQGVSRDVRKSFIFSGTVHLFTVSGLHVGILALLLGFCFRPLPFRIRYLVIPVALFIYVAATGMNAPSVRAFLMIALWSWSRAFMLRTPGLNTVFLVAALLLLYNPGYLYDMGFQYSFLVVTFLLISSNCVGRWRDLAFERWRWIPSSRHTFLSRIRLQIFGRFGEILFGCTVAWLAGSVLSLYYQGILFPLSVATNILLIPLIWPLYPLILFASFSQSCASAIEFILETIKMICNGFYLNFDSISCARPEVWMILLFFFAFTMLLTVRKRFMPTAAIIVILTLFGFWRWQALSMPPSVLIINGDDVTASMILFLSQDETIAINAPTYELANAAVDQLRIKGVFNIGTLFFTGNLKKQCGGGQKLLSSMAVGKMVITAQPTGRQYLYRVANSAVSMRIPIVEHADKLKFISKNTSNRIEYRHNNFNINLDIIRINRGRVKMILQQPGFEPYEMDFTNSNILEVTEYVFERR